MLSPIGQLHCCTGGCLRTIDISGIQGACHGEVSMAAAATIPTSLVRLPLWHAGLTPRPIVSFAFSVARGLVRGGERESSHLVRGID